MNKLFIYLKDNSDKLLVKIIVLFIFISLLTGTDLIVKQVAYKNLKNKPDVIVIPGFWQFHYVTNDDIGFSILRWLGKYLDLPKKISVNDYENKIIKNISDDYRKEFLNTYYIKDTKKNCYILKNNIDEFTRENLKSIFSSIDYRTPKWLFLVFLQGSASLIVFIFYIKSNKWKYLFPLAFVICGAMGNLIDRIIRGYVVDYVMWTIKILPFQIFNPWPIFNLADVFTVIGASILFLVVFFFSKDDE